MARRQFIPLVIDDIQWTGTNKAELDAKFGVGWEEALRGRPLLVGNWLYQLYGTPTLYIMHDDVRENHTLPIKGRGRGE